MRVGPDGLLEVPLDSPPPPAVGHGGMGAARKKGPLRPKDAGQSAAGAGGKGVDWSGY